MQPKLHGKNAEEIFNSSGSRISSATERPYTFVGLQVTGAPPRINQGYEHVLILFRSDDDAFLDTCNTVELGDITLKIVRTTKSRKKVPQLHDFSPRLLEEKIVHERMKKATPHSVKYVSPESWFAAPNRTLKLSRLGDEVTPARSCLLKNLLSFREQIVKFTFKYRPIGTVYLCSKPKPLHPSLFVDFLRAEGKVISDTQSQLPAASPGPDKAETSSNSMKPDVISPTIKKEDPNERHDEALNTTKIKTLEVRSHLFLTHISRYSQLPLALQEEILQKKEELQTLRKKEDKAAKIRALRVSFELTFLLEGI